MNTKYWCPQCQRNFSKLSLDDEQSGCPSCGTQSRKLNIQSPIIGNRAQTRSDSNQDQPQKILDQADTCQTQLDEEILKEPQINQPRPSISRQGAFSFPDTLSFENRSNPLTTSNEQVLDGLEFQEQQEQELQPTSDELPHRPHIIIIIHTTLLGGPDNRIIFRTGHLIPQSQELTGINASQIEAQQNRGSRFMELLSRLNPLRLLRREGRQGSQQVHSEEANQEDGLDLNLSQTRSDPIATDTSQVHDPNPRIIINPFDYFASRFIFENLVEALLQNDLSEDGVPPASDGALNQIEEANVSKDEGTLCPICHEDFLVEEKIAKLPCKHGYHKNCVTKWLKMHNACPICRTSICENTIPNP